MNEISLTLEEACPLTTVKAKAKAPTWWNEDLQTAKFNLKKAYQKAYKINLPSLWLIYKNKRNIFRKAICKSQKDSWRKFTSTCDINLLNKILDKDKNKSSVGNLKLPCGNYTIDSIDTINQSFSDPAISSDSDSD
jgi:hypothetical protein